MDHKFWIQTSPDVKTHHTVKKFYGKYLWKLHIQVEAARAIEGEESIDARIARRLKNAEDARIYHGPDWAPRITAANVDIPFLKNLRQIRNEFSDTTRARIEEPHGISFFAHDEDTLKRIADRLLNKSAISRVYGPSSVETIKILDSDSIIVTRPTSFKYKVILRSGRFPVDVKKQVLDYLTSVSSSVNLNNGPRKNLLKDFSSLWGAYFYTNDLGIATFLQLIHPDLILKIHPVVYVPNK